MNSIRDNGVLNVSATRSRQLMKWNFWNNFATIVAPFAINSRKTKKGKKCRNHLVNVHNSRFTAFETIQHYYAFHWVITYWQNVRGINRLKIVGKCNNFSTIFRCWNTYIDLVYILKIVNISFIWICYKMLFILIGSITKDELWYIIFDSFRTFLFLIPHPSSPPGIGHRIVFSFTKANSTTLGTIVYCSMPMTFVCIFFPPFTYRSIHTVLDTSFLVLKWDHFLHSLFPYSNQTNRWHTHTHERKKSFDWRNYFISFSNTNI